MWLDSLRLSNVGIVDHSRFRNYLVHAENYGYDGIKYKHPVRIPLDGIVVLDSTSDIITGIEIGLVDLSQLISMSVKYVYPDSDETKMEIDLRSIEFNLNDEPEMAYVPLVLMPRAHLSVEIDFASLNYDGWMLTLETVQLCTDRRREFINLFDDYNGNIPFIIEE